MFVVLILIFAADDLSEGVAAISSVFQLSEQLTVCQKELQAQVQELDRLKKIYTDEESVAIDAREKASAAEEK